MIKARLLLILAILGVALIAPEALTRSREEPQAEPTEEQAPPGDDQRPARESNPETAPAPETEDFWKDYPTREVQRPPLCPRGGMETSFSLTSLATTAVFDAEGDPTEIDLNYNLFLARVGFRFGLTDRWEVSAVAFLPQRRDRLHRGRRDRRSPVRDPGGPDPPPELFPDGRGRVFDPALRPGLHFYPLEDGLNVSSFRAGDPSYGYFPGLESRLLLDPVSLRLSVRGIFTPAGVITYQYKDLPIEEVVADFGDGYQAEFTGSLQVSDRWVFRLGLEYLNLGETAIDGDRLHDQWSRFTVTPGVMYAVSPSSTSSSAPATSPPASTLPPAFPSPFRSGPGGNFLPGGKRPKTANQSQVTRGQ